MGMFLRRGLRGASLEHFAEGALVKLNENGVPAEFYVAKHGYEPELNGAGRTLLVRKDCYDKRAFHYEGHNVYVSGLLDTWYTGTYALLLDSGVQAALGTTIYCTPGDTDREVTTVSRTVFGLSAAEFGLAAKYINVEGSVLPTAEILKIANYGGAAIRQWTRTPYITSSNYAAYVDTDGTLSSNTSSGSRVQATNASRPALTLPSRIWVNEDMVITGG